MPEDYIQSLKDLHYAIYYNGKFVEDITEHPGIRPHINSAALTYELALRLEYEDMNISITSLLLLNRWG
jgi:4-hydroxybutyryl-CoA dehydratase/vinylacetyl-CoA-Delta-isomerase